MFTNVLTKATVLALAAIGSSTASPLEARNDFSEKMLEVTNWWRAQHNANPVSWDQGLADAATDWANQCQMRHSHGAHGENLAWGNIGPSSPGFWVNLWGKERVDFDFNHGGFGKTGHFTQLVWKDTNKMGCAWVKCGNDDYIVCEYSPAGNVGSPNNESYRQNVGHQISGDINDVFQG